jgi:hypothetical protein
MRLCYWVGRGIFGHCLREGKINSDEKIITAIGR